MALHSPPAQPTAVEVQMKRGAAYCQLLFGVVFTCGALFVAFLFVLQPALKMREASQWKPTPCVITHNRVVWGRSRSSTKRRSKTTYSLALRYQYQVAGHAYQGTTYSFDTPTVSGREEVGRVGRQLPQGTPTTCWVNPAQPAESVLRRDAQQPRIRLLLPLVFLGAGIALCVGALRTLRSPL